MNFIISSEIDYSPWSFKWLVIFDEPLYVNKNALITIWAWSFLFIAQKNSSKLSILCSADSKLLGVSLKRFSKGSDSSSRYIILVKISTVYPTIWRMTINIVFNLIQKLLYYHQVVRSSSRQVFACNQRMQSFLQIFS